MRSASSERSCGVIVRMRMSSYSKFDFTFCAKLIVSKALTALITIFLSDVSDERDSPAPPFEFKPLVHLRLSSAGLWRMTNSLALNINSFHGSSP